MRQVANINRPRYAVKNCADCDRQEARDAQFDGKQIAGTNRDDAYGQLRPPIERAAHDVAHSTISACGNDTVVSVLTCITRT